MTGSIAMVQDRMQFNICLDGPERAPCLVFSNSLMTNLSLWDGQVAALSDRFRILRYDQRGHGGTAVPPGPATMEQLADDVAGIMGQLGIRSATFVGISMGAATGLALAQRHPYLVNHLVCADGGAATAPGGVQSWEERIALARQGGMAALAGPTVARWFATPDHPAIPTVRAMIETTPLDGFVACARALQDYDLRPGLPAMRVPTLFVAGAADGVLPDTMRDLAGMVADGRHEVIAGAGHLPCVEQTGAFNAVLDGFLSGRR